MSYFILIYIMLKNVSIVTARLRRPFLAIKEFILFYNKAYNDLAKNMLFLRIFKVVTYYVT